MHMYIIYKYKKLKNNLLRTKSIIIFTGGKDICCATWLNLGYAGAVVAWFVGS